MREVPESGNALIFTEASLRDNFMCIFGVATLPGTCSSHAFTVFVTASLSEESESEESSCFFDFCVALALALVFFGFCCCCFGLDVDALLAETLPFAFEMQTLGKCPVFPQCLQSQLRALHWWFSSLCLPHRRHLPSLANWRARLGAEAFDCIVLYCIVFVNGQIYMNTQVIHRAALQESFRV